MKKQILKILSGIICIFGILTIIPVKAVKFRVEAKKDMLDKNPELRNMYSEYDDNTAVLYFESGKAVISSFTEEPKIINF